MDTKDYFNLVNTSNYIQNINQGKTAVPVAPPAKEKVAENKSNKES